ncbi:MAG: putative ABC transporter permease [Clostridia bacterium]|nr:putative ABC transporter permease [Clostridia bacterium]
MGKKIVNFSIKIFWIFVIGSVFGFFAEMLYALVYTRTLEIRQGLIYGPFIQIYGMGAVAYYILISNIQEPKKAFVSGMIMGGSLEYLCSFFQEIFFGTISWEYSHLFMNLNGRTSLLYCFYWGIIAIVYLKMIYPAFQKMEPLVEKTGVRIFTVFFMLFMTFDIVISCMAGNRQQERRQNIPAKSSMDEFLDQMYPDELLDRIYNNKKNV